MTTLISVKLDGFQSFSPNKPAIVRVYVNSAGSAVSLNDDNGNDKIFRKNLNQNPNERANFLVFLTPNSRVKDIGFGETTITGYTL